MSSSKGMDASLAILRRELEGMQKQDKAIYVQLLTLRESIQGLKSELRKEREECEEAFKDLEENSRKAFDDEIFMTETGQHSNETGEEKQSSSEKIWKHDRQDSGISVKTPDVDPHETAPSNQTKFSTEDLVMFSTSDPVSKPAVILHDLNTRDKTTNVEITQKTSSFLKPPLILHSKQDSGILIDEEAVKDTTLLSRLVESSEMFEKLETRKYDWIIQQEYQKVREKTTVYNHQRSRSSNDLLLKPQHQRSLPHQYSLGNLRPTHARTNSCPQNMLQQFTSQGREKPPLNQFIELDKLDKKLGRSQDANLNNPSQRSATPSEFNTSVLRSGSTNIVPKAAFRSVVPKHLHTRSLPSASIRGLAMPENEFTRRGNRRSMQNIAAYKVVPAHQMRPRQRSASVVDVDEDSTRERTLTPHTAKVLPRQKNDDGIKQGKDNTKENTQTPHKVPIVQVDGSEQAQDNKQSLNQAKGNLPSDRIPSPVIKKSEQSLSQANNKPQSKPVHANHLKATQEIKMTQDKSNETGEPVKTTNALRAVLVSAREVNVSNTTQHSPLSRRCSLDEKSTGSYRPGDVPQRRFTITKFEADRISQRQQFENGRFSPRFATPHSLHHSRNHLRHHTMPEYDDMRRRHSLYTYHAPSRSWDGYSKKTNEVKTITRSASQVSLV